MNLVQECYIQFEISLLFRTLEELKKRVAAAQERVSELMKFVENEKKGRVSDEI